MTDEKPCEHEAFARWRQEIAEVAAAARYKGAGLSQRIADALQWGELTLEALLNLAEAPHIEARLTVCETLAAMLKSAQPAITPRVRKLILWMLGDRLKDEEENIRGLAHALLQRHLAEEPYVYMV